MSIQSQQIKKKGAPNILLSYRISVQYIDSLHAHTYGGMFHFDAEYFYVGCENRLILFYQR